MDDGRFARYIGPMDGKSEKTGHVRLTRKRPGPVQRMCKSNRRLRSAGIFRPHRLNVWIQNIVLRAARGRTTACLRRNQEHVEALRVMFTYVFSFGTYRRPVAVSSWKHFFLKIDSTWFVKVEDDGARVSPGGLYCQTKNGGDPRGTCCCDKVESGPQPMA